MRFVLWGAILSSALIGSAVTATSAQSAGLDGLHGKIQIGNRLCMAGHKHHGAGSARGTREQALASATKSWGSFTALEYGSEWADFSKSTNQEIECRPSSSGPGPAHWTCSVTSSPCRVTSPGPVVAPQRRAQGQGTRPAQPVRLDR